MKLYSVTEFAKKNKVSRQAILARIKRGTLKAIRVGNVFVIEESSPQ